MVQGVSVSSLQLEQTPPRLVAPPVPTAAQAPPLDRAVAAASRRGSTGGDVIVVSVGPYHQLESRLSSLITIEKKKAIVKFLSEPTFGLDTNKFLEWARARGEEDTARPWYTGNMRSEELANMLLHDGCLVLFAVFLLRKSSVQPDPLCLPEAITETATGSTDLANAFHCLSSDILKNKKETRLDLLLLGNQIPFFVLTELHTRLKDTLFKGVKGTLEEIALSCFDDIRPSPIAKPSTRVAAPRPAESCRNEIKAKFSCWFERGNSSRAATLPSTNPSPSPSPSPITNPSPSTLSQDSQVHHLLHLFHSSRVQPGKHQPDRSAPAPLLGEPESNLPCATWFEDSCISFSKQAAAPGTLHMGFQRNMLGMRGVLRVPALHIHAYSNLVFHNLIAFEQSNVRSSGSSLAVTTYSVCMARLLQCEADAKLLRKKGILAHTHETDEMIVRLFRELAHDFRHAYYSKDLLDLCNDVDAHHHSTAARANRFILQCFPGQTVTFFVILGALFSVATFINAIYSVYRFSHPAKQ
ncbi:hypothetical protein ACQ4PT_037391 [Festuca glaucescens]